MLTCRKVSTLKGSPIVAVREAIFGFGRPLQGRYHAGLIHPGVLATLVPPALTGDAFSVLPGLAKNLCLMPTASALQNRPLDEREVPLFAQNPPLFAQNPPLFAQKVAFVTPTFGHKVGHYARRLLPREVGVLKFRSTNVCAKRGEKHRNQGFNTSFDVCESSKRMLFVTFPRSA